MDLFWLISILFVLYLLILPLFTLFLGFDPSVLFFIFLSIALWLTFIRFALMRQEALIHGIGHSNPLNRWILSHTAEFYLNELSFSDLSNCRPSERIQRKT